MDMLRNDFTPEYDIAVPEYDIAVPNHYVAAMEYEYAGMINTLCYLRQEADNAKLDFVGLHLNIAIEELKEHRRMKSLAATK